MSEYENSEFQGKVAVITGAGNGLGNSEGDIESSATVMSNTPQSSSTVSNGKAALLKQH